MCYKERGKGEFRQGRKSLFVDREGWQKEYVNRIGVKEGKFVRAVERGRHGRVQSRRKGYCYDEKGRVEKGKLLKEVSKEINVTEKKGKAGKKRVKVD